ncbi:MAG: permease-like cell division protein FtsX [bacterium]
MSKLKVFFYSLQDGFYNLKRGGTTDLISIITIAFTMLNLGLFFLLWINIAPHLQGCLNEVKVVGYLKEGISEARVKSLNRELKAIPEVKKVRFISKSEAMKCFKASLGEDKYLIEGLQENPLPASFELIIDEASGMGALDRAAEYLQAQGEFEEVQSGREWIHRLSVFLFLIKTVGFIVGGVLLFVSLFIISNTVRLTFVNRKEEVEIMRLVGANHWFIKTPFFIEGMLNGFLGGLISVGLLYLLFQGVKYKLSPYLLEAVGMIHISFIPLSVIFLLIGMGMGVGGVGSLISLRF